MPRAMRFHVGHAGQLLQSLRPLVGFVRELRLYHIGSRNAGLERHRSIERNQLTVIDDGDAVAQMVGLFHVMRGNQHGEMVASSLRLSSISHTATRETGSRPVVGSSRKKMRGL